MKNIVFIFIFFIAFIIKVFENKRVCGIDLLKKPKRVLVKQDDSQGRFLKEDNWEPIRIHLDFSYLENNVGRISKEDMIDLTEKIMPKTQEIFQNLLKVKRIKGRLKLNAPTCETFPIPERYHDSGEGVEADLVIFVLIDESGFFAENRIEAAAIHCLQHYETRRPLAGYIQFKQNLNVTNSTALDYMVWLAVHEVSHILAINDALYDDYINASTMVPHGYSRIIGKKILPNGKKMNFIRSPKVLEKARSHFNCPTLDGVPLEYNGGPGTAGSHWSKKYMNTDYMIGDSYGENLISDITMALFEDSGWYKVDFQMSNLFLWGRGKGCDFFDKKCIERPNNRITTQFPDEFCTKLNYPTCSVSNVFRGECRARRFKEELNTYERYFEDPKVGGVDQLTDKCPIAVEDKGDQSYYGGSCRVGDRSNVNNSLEKVCPECACFMSNLRREDEDERKSSLSKMRFKMKFKNQTLNSSKNSTNETSDYSLMKRTSRDETEFDEDPKLTTNDLLASCYEFRCDGEKLYVKVLNREYICPSNQEIKMKGYFGRIKCPVNENLCHKKYKCKYGCTELYSNERGFIEYAKNSEMHVLR
jgi:hypothetical protein